MKKEKEKEDLVLVLHDSEILDLGLHLGFVGCLSGYWLPNKRARFELN